MGVTLKSDLSDLSDLSDKMGASRYTPWVCLPLWGLASAKSYRWVILLIGAPTATLITLIILIILIILISAARRV